MSNRIPDGWRYSHMLQAYVGPDGRIVDGGDEAAILKLIQRGAEVADEIRNQNVVAVWLDGSDWHARIGPAGLGLESVSNHPARALRTLASAIEIKGWPFDPSYRPRPGPSLHDA